MDKMIDNENIRRKWNSIVKNMTGGRAIAASKPTRRRDEEVVLLIREPRSALAERHDRFYADRERCRMQDVRLAAARDFQRSQRSGVGPWRPIHDPEFGLVMVR